MSFHCIFYKIEKLKKYVVKVRIRKLWELYVKDASFCFNLRFFVLLGYLVRGISGVEIKNEFFCLKWSNSAEKNRTKSTKKEFEA